jgi:hypothetical protein
VERSVRGLSTLPQEIHQYLHSAKPAEPNTQPLGQLQNPESQARYTGYIVKFVCFYLQIIADEEAQILQYQQEQASQQAQQAQQVQQVQQAQQTQQGEITNSKSNMLYSNKSTAGGSNVESNSSTQPCCRLCKQDKIIYPNIIKDARKLFT